MTDVSPRLQRLRAESAYYNAQTSERMSFGSDAYLCGGMEIKKTQQWKPEGNPFWVMKVTGEIINDHGDVFNPNFQTFIHHTYLGLRSAMGD